MEGSSISDLPPSKRFKLLQCHGKPESEADPHCLPAKKRIGRQHNQGPTPLCLPAKKRIWAINPQEDIDDSIDLNQEEEEQKKKIGQEVAGEDEDDGVVCAVCSSTDGNPSDPIVFCDGCDLMVHVSCYGSPLVASVPDGDWLCRRCESVGPTAVECQCCLCPGKGGAVKPTVDGRWAHITCALFVPEAYFHDPEGREGIDVLRVPPERWEVGCCLCGCRSGCGIVCSEPGCELGFHVSCGLEEGHAIEYMEGKGGAIVAGFCKDHTLLWKKQQLTGKFKIVSRSGCKRKVKG